MACVLQNIYLILVIYWLYTGKNHIKYFFVLYIMHGFSFFHSVIPFLFCVVQMGVTGFKTLSPSYLTRNNHLGHLFCHFGCRRGIADENEMGIGRRGSVKVKKGGCGFGRKIRETISMKIKKQPFLISENGLSERCIDSRSWTYQPRTLNQRAYVDHLVNSSVSVLVGLGPAGSGKTLFACSAAVSYLKQGLVDRIIITRPLVSVDEEELGFLPGSIENKMDPWTRPIFDIFGEFFSVTQIKSMVKSGVIEISPLAYMRGRTFKRAFIIADEMQNSSPSQMLLMLTRIGESSKLVITGDLKQTDRAGLNGLADFMQKIRRASVVEDSSMIRFVELENNDIQRSLVVSHILNIYDSASCVTGGATGSETGRVGKSGVNSSQPMGCTSCNHTTNVSFVNLSNNGFRNDKNTTKLNDDAALIPISHFRVLKKNI